MLIALPARPSGEPGHHPWIHVSDRLPLAVGCASPSAGYHRRPGGPGRLNRQGRDCPGYCRACTRRCRAVLRSGDPGLSDPAILGLLQP